MSVWIAIICTGCLTFATRFLALSSLMPDKLPDWLRLAMRFVPVSVLSAMILPSILISNETGAIHFQDNMRIIAALAAIVVAYYTRSTVITIISGLSVIWLLTFWQ
ncbi:MAG: AzlD domain-containing protein [Alphaproteobacteria bacterium]|jgi:branched-subunit amino acid transport protein|nr:AzlD domain-containing protein [Alphaproteobacteria bacterium]